MLLLESKERQGENTMMSLKEGATDSIKESIEQFGFDTVILDMAIERANDYTVKPSTYIIDAWRRYYVNAVAMLRAIKH